MARQRLGSADAPPSQLDDAPPGGITPVPEPPAELGPLLTLHKSEVIGVKGETAINTGNWEDLDLSSLPTFEADVGEIVSFDARFGTSGGWTWNYPDVGNSIPSPVTVTITDDQGRQKSVQFTTKVQKPPLLAVTPGEEVTDWAEGSTATVNGVWADFDMVPHANDLEFSVAPPGVEVTKAESGPVFINGTWQWQKASITPADAGEYTITAVDSDGHPASVVFTITVTPTTPNVLPTITIDPAHVGPTIKIAGESINLTGAWTDTDNASTVTIEEIGSSIGSVSVQNAGTAGSTWSWDTGALTEADSGTVHFRITDDQGGVDDVFLDLLINPAVLTLVGTPLMFNVAEGTVVTCDLTWTDSDGIDTGPGIAEYSISPNVGTIDSLGSGTTGTNTWTSPTLTNAAHDGLTITITLTDANGNPASVDIVLAVQAPAVNIPPTIDAPLLQADSWNIADYQAFMEIGSPGVFQGIWGDEDASGVKPVEKITTIDNLLLQPFGTVDPVTGSSAFESTSGVWQVSSSNHDFNLHGAIITVEITDDDGLTDDVTVRLDLGVDDNPLRMIPGHPEPAIAVWQPTNFNINWTSDPRAVSLGAGYVLQNQFALPGNQAEWDLTALAAFSSRHIYRPQFTAHLPDATTRIQCRVYHTPNGGSESLVQAHTFEGPLVPATLDDYTIELHDIDMTNEGDFARILMWTEKDGVTDSIQPQETAGLLENAFFERDPPGVNPPPVGVEVWRFEPQRITQAAWDAHVVAGDDFVAIPSGRLANLGGVNTLAMPPGNQLIRFPINYVTPERNASGSIRNHLSLNSIVNSKFQSHCMIQPFTNDGMLRSGAYTKEGQAYRWAMTLDMPEGRNWTPIPWAVIVQVHANNWGPAWGESQQPMIALNIEQDQWRGYARGSTEVNPTGYTHSTNVFSPFVPGKQQVIIEWRLDPLSEFTGNAYCKMTVNGTTFLDVTHPVGVNYSGLGASDTGGWLSHGYYGGHPERLVAAGSDASLQPWVDIEYSRLTEIP